MWKRYDNNLLILQINILLICESKQIMSMKSHVFYKQLFRNLTKLLNFDMMP